MAQQTPEAAPGQIWERPNKSRFTLVYVRGRYAGYWLETGSRPQHREIRLDVLGKRYRLIQNHLISDQSKRAR